MQVGVRRVKKSTRQRPIYVNESHIEQRAKVTLPSVQICELSFEEWNRKIEEKINDHRKSTG